VFIHHGDTENTVSTRLSKKKGAAFAAPPGS
jgi:hypothetical protein